jgi:outer membrane protein assembly factor BamB
MATRLAVLLALAAPAAAFAADWPQFLGPDRNQTSAEKGLLDAWPKDGPPAVWKHDAGQGYAGPVVVGDRLVLFHRVGDEDVVECLNATDGKPLWKTGVPTRYRDPLGKGDGPRATPLVAGGRVYVLGANGLLQCLELDSGKPVWRKELLKEYQVKPSYFGVGTSPILEGGKIVVNVGGKGGAGIVAFDAADGKEVWKATDHDASYASPVAADLDGVRQLLFFTREGLASLDPADGKVRYTKRWRSRMEASVNAASPVVTDGHIFLSACYGTGAVLLKAKKDGVEEVWKGDESLSCHFGTPVVADGFLYGFDGREEEGTRLRCVELKTGKVRWEKDGFGAGSLILADGRLLVLDEGGDLLLVDADPKAYRERSRAKVLNGPVRAHPALANGRLYARDGEKLVCWDLRKK